MMTVSLSTASRQCTQIALRKRALDQSRAASSGPARRNLPRNR
jgi:hypothetical protein